MARFTTVEDGVEMMANFRRFDKCFGADLTSLCRAAKYLLCNANIGCSDDAAMVNSRCEDVEINSSNFVGAVADSGKWSDTPSGGNQIDSR